MASDEYIKALRIIAQERGIPQEELVHLIEDSLAKAYIKTLSEEEKSAAEVYAVVNEKGYKVFCKKKVSLYVNNPRLEISIDDTEKINPNATIGDIIEVEVTPSNFGRVAANVFKQAINQKINETERNKIYEQFETQIGKIVTGYINRKDIKKDGSSVYVIDFGKVEGILPYKEQIPGEAFSTGDLVKFYLLDVRADENKNLKTIELSRTHPGFVKRLFELETPEIADGTVEIQAIVREAGLRTKISVSTRNENVEPLGACIGTNSSRIQAILNHLNGEKIDIIEYSDDPSKYITNALSPATPISIEITEEVIKDEKRLHATVTVPKKQLSLAIGKGGINAKLAAKLTKCKMDIIAED
ncbi:MAG: transcription termination/antitermination protein NusA [Armatimonadetes bacterium]|nr:transcription termination/antitermination protein NusA [Candidatus Hippobium faecium]